MLRVFMLEAVGTRALRVDTGGAGTHVGVRGVTQVLLQQGSKLYLVDMAPLSRDLM
jgi:hypothetical protein